jgi:hypothetical protein
LPSGDAKARGEEEEEAGASGTIGEYWGFTIGEAAWGR